MRSEIGLGAGLVQADPQALGVARQVRAVALRIEIHLPKRESRFGGKRGGMRLQVGLQFRIARLRRRGEAVGDEFHLLLQAAADDEVVLVQAQRQRLAVIDFLPHPVPDQALQLLAGGRPLPGADEALRHGRDLALRDDDLSPVVAGALGHQAVGRKDRRPQQEEMQQRFVQRISS